MSDIKAGIVIMNQYSHPQSKSFGSYVDYIDRKEAVRKENDFKYGESGKKYRSIYRRKMGTQ